MRISWRELTRIAGLLILSSLAVTKAYAANFPLPPDNEALIGEVQYTAAENGDTAATIAERYNLGQNVLIEANPGVTERYSLPNGASVKVPTQFLLPPLPRKG